MRLKILLFALFVFSAASCKESKTDEDALDGEEDPAPDPEADPVPDPVFDDGPGDGEEEAPPDAPDVESDGPPACAEHAVTCGGRTGGLVQPTAEGNLDKYYLHGRLLEYDESGSEFVVSFLAEDEVQATAEIVDLSDGDLDIIVLEEACSAEAAAAFGNSQVSWRTVPGTLYFIVVDGRDGSSGAFELYVTCEADFEICDNGADDNDDGFTDCSDGQCSGIPPCMELTCGDGADDDGDGDTDCDDYDCIGATDCAGGTGEIADPCDSHDDCASGQCYMETETGWPGGYCIHQSSVLTCDDLVCPGDSHCEPLGFTSATGPWVCAIPCSDEEPCRAGYLCEDHLCFPLCTSASQCVETGYCNYDRGYCVTEPTEVCTNEADDDGDGAADCDDTECMFRGECAEPEALDGGDTCGEAAAITLPAGERGTVVIAGTTEAAADDYTPGCESIDSADVAYSMTLTADALVKIDLLGGRVEPRIQDTILYVRDDCDAADLACNNDISEGVYMHSFLEISLTAGTYFIMVDGFDSLTGLFTLGINLSDP
jgi:hypothetical protein